MYQRSRAQISGQFASVDFIGSVCLLKIPWRDEAGRLAEAVKSGVFQDGSDKVRAEKRVFAVQLPAEQDARKSEQAVAVAVPFGHHRVDADAHPPIFVFGNGQPENGAFGGAVKGIAQIFADHPGKQRVAELFPPEAVYFTQLRIEGDGGVVQFVLRKPLDRLAEPSPGCREHDINGGSRRTGRSGRHGESLP